MPVRRPPRPVTIVADSSPLIVLAKLGCFDLLHKLYPRIYISAEVHHEVVVAGAGLPGASEVANATWIQVKPLQDRGSLLVAQQRFPLGAGELNTIFLGRKSSPMSCYSMTTMHESWPGRTDSTFAAAWVCSKCFINAVIFLICAPSFSSS